MLNVWDKKEFITISQGALPLNYNEINLPLLCPAFSYFSAILSVLHKVRFINLNNILWKVYDLQYSQNTISRSWEITNFFGHFQNIFFSFWCTLSTCYWDSMWSTFVLNYLAQHSPGFPLCHTLHILSIILRLSPLQIQGMGRGPGDSHAFI